jgi:hypothetical protein
MTPEQHAQRIRQIAFMLEKADYGLGMPRDYQRVLELRTMLNEPALVTLAWVTWPIGQASPKKPAAPRGRMYLAFGTTPPRLPPRRPMLRPTGDVAAVSIQVVIEEFYGDSSTEAIAKKVRKRPSVRPFPRFSEFITPVIKLRKRPNRGEDMRRVRRVFAERNEIVRALSTHGKRKLPKAERAANAALIAAAPDMLDLARNVAGLDDQWLANANERRLRDLIHEYREQARAAIAKAEGTS